MDAFIEQAWNDHESDLPGVSARLRDRLPRLAEWPGQAADFALLAEHVWLAHGGDTDAMGACVDVLQPLAPQDARLASALARARAAAALLQDEPAAATGLPPAAAIRAHATAASGFAARDDIAAARRVLQRAGALADDAGAADADAARAYAAGCNNLASQLLDGPRGTARDALMMDAAQQARGAWARAGTWLNEERADYLLARCAAAVGDTAAALAHARSCLAICEANAADAFERFFAHEALGLALRAAGDADAADRARARMGLLIDDIAEAGLRAHAQASLARFDGVQGRA